MLCDFSGSAVSLENKLTVAYSLDITVCILLLDFLSSLLRRLVSLSYPCLGAVITLSVHCNPGEASMRFITATCEAGTGATPKWILDICIWTFLILQFVDRCYFQKYTFDLSKWQLYIKIVML